MASNNQPPIVLQPDTPMPQLVAFINQNFQSLSNAISPLIVSDGTSNRIILGKQPDGTYGLKISQSGVDVASATNTQLVFNSSQDVFKIVRSGTTILPDYSFSTGANLYGGGSTNITVNHGLGFLPAVLAYISSSGFYQPVPFYDTDQYSTTYYINRGITYSIDSNNIYFFLNVFGYNKTVASTVGGGTIKYYLLQETAN